MAVGNAGSGRLTSELRWIINAQREFSERGARAPGRPRRSAGRRSSQPWWQNGFEVYPPDWADRGIEDFSCCRGELLVDDVDLPRVRETLGRENVSVSVADSLLGGVTLLTVDREVGSVLEQLDDRLGIGVATPNHVLSITPVGGRCPATEPEQPGRTTPWPGAGAEDDGAGVRVAVVDTGFLQGWDSRSSWLSGITEYDIDDPDVLQPRGYIDPYAGHGTFIAGVVRCMAPSVEVTVDRSLELAGVIDEASLVMQIGDALARSPDVISVSAGGYTRNNVPPKAFTALWEQRLRHHKGVAFVAAAGNNDTRQPFWPAAFPWAVSVGALTADGLERAEFSNHGGWVDVYAPGVDIVNAYCEGEYRLLLDPNEVRTFDGMCKWSGTSFSTPMVAGLIAARMSRTGENGRQAADALLDAARGQFLPGVGPRLLP
jgi:subtilisin family serine protease